MFVGSFSPDDYNGFQSDVADAIAEFKQAGVTRLLIDLSNNGGTYLRSLIVVAQMLIIFTGGYVCLGEFLHQYLAGESFGYPFVASKRSP